MAKKKKKDIPSRQELVGLINTTTAALLAMADGVRLDPNKVDLIPLLKAERNKAFQEAFECVKTHMKTLESSPSYKEDREKGDHHLYGQINLLRCVMQDIDAKMTGVRKWS